MAVHMQDKYKQEDLARCRDQPSDHETNHVAA